MKRTVRIYKYKCDNCGWEAFRAEIIPVGLCSKCGNTNPPIISTEDKEFEFDATIEKATEYVRRLKEGEDPVALDKEIFDGIDVSVPITMVREVSFFISSYKWPAGWRGTTTKEPLVY